MSKKRLNVFIQDLKDTTTVLQQLEACIKSCKDVLSSVDTIEQSVEDLDINEAESLLNTVEEQVNNILDVLPNKQDKLIAGDNISIENNVISGVPALYTAGDNIQIEGSVISATDTTYTAGENIYIIDGVISSVDTTYIAGDNVQIVDDVISATDTIYTAGSNITINAQNVISATDTTYTAGANVQINGNVISATDTTYTAGENISITGNVISAPQVSNQYYLHRVKLRNTEDNSFFATVLVLIKDNVTISNSNFSNYSNRIVSIKELFTSNGYKPIQFWGENQGAVTIYDDAGTSYVLTSVDTDTAITI